MKALKIHRGIIAPLDRSNVDTDQIIPKQFLKKIERTGFGEHLFHDWRYKPDGSPNSQFVLNNPRFKKASILLARNNFGCGSSREHAVWAIEQYGLRVIIAPWVAQKDSQTAAFADIFRSNCVKNAVLTVELSEPEVNQIFHMTERFPGLEATADVEAQTITLHLEEEITYRFEIELATKERLIHGLDDISLTLQRVDTIRAFEEHHDTQI